MIAFLIDADNLSGQAAIDEAFETLESTEGPIAIRRAYGSAEKLKSVGESMRRWAIRPYANMSLPKNTTDLSLAVDAMELACQAPMPRVMVIGSGDMDFVPLVVRLRERGIRVLCVCQESTMAQDAVAAYDRVIYVGADQTANSADIGAKALPATKSPSVAVAKKAVAKKKTVAKKAPAKSVAASKTPAKKVAKKVTTTTTKTSDTTVESILAAIPSLRNGQWHTLGEVSKTLHDAQLLAKNATSSKLFRKFADHFELVQAAGLPNQVRYLVQS